MPWSGYPGARLGMLDALSHYLRAQAWRERAAAAHGPGRERGAACWWRIVMTMGAAAMNCRVQWTGKRRGVGPVLPLHWRSRRATDLRHGRPGLFGCGGLRPGRAGRPKPLTSRRRPGRNPRPAPCGRADRHPGRRARWSSRYSTASSCPEGECRRVPPRAPACGSDLVDEGLLCGAGEALRVKIRLRGAWAWLRRHCAVLRVHSPISGPVRRAGPSVAPRGSRRMVACLCIKVQRCV